MLNAFTDMLGRSVEISTSNRIISLVPSQTELLYDLGLHDRIIGKTVFCIHPKEYFKIKTKVGGTKKVKYEVIDELKPDLIICNKEENTPEIVKQLEKKYPVWCSDIQTIQDNYKMIFALGEITQTTTKALELVQKIQFQFETLTFNQLKTCVYLIWNEPIMAAGKQTFINEMMKHAGFVNLMSIDSRYPELSIEELKTLNPEYLLLSSEPFPFKEKHLVEFKKHLPNTIIKIVNGEFFSWYGSRLIQSPTYFKSLLV